MAAPEDPISISKEPETVKAAQSNPEPEEASSAISSPQEHVPSDIHVVDFVKVKPGDEDGPRDNDRACCNACF